MNLSLRYSPIEKEWQHMPLDKPDFETLKLYVKALPGLSSVKKNLVIKTLDQLWHEFFEEARQFGFGAGVANLRKKRAKT